MQELVGRLTALDPDASESLKVIGYFDTLVAAGSGPGAILRGAATLSGATAGAERNGRITRYGPDGRALTGTDFTRSAQRSCAGGHVWLEREGAAHANDQMILERTALSMDLIDARNHPAGDLEIVIDPARSREERTKALARMRIAPHTKVRLVATRSEARPTEPLTALIPTPDGIVQATLCRSATHPASLPAGLGTWASAEDAPDSWEAALIALKLTEPGVQVIDATDLGALLMLARAHDPHAPHEDVIRLSRLDRRTAKILRTLVEAESLRSAAAILGIHHSTLQARHESLTRELGYDPRTAGGKVRYSAAEFLLKLTPIRRDD